MSSLVNLSIKDHVAIVTLNSPENRNAISDRPMVDALVATLETINQNIDVHAAILTGSGSTFSSGGNIKTMGAAGGLNDPLPVNTRRNYREGIQRIPLAFNALDVPVIAAINGPAIGAGLDLTCMCDIRVASSSAVFAESFVKLGLIPGDGGAWLLPRVVGFSVASELALTGKTINADEALACGLVSQVVDPGELLDTAQAIADEIAANPVHAVRMTKRLLREAQKNDLATVLEISAGFQAIAHATDDHKEAIAAFLEKRAPQFNDS